MAERQRLLELALKGLEAERVKIDDEIAQLRAQLNGAQPVRGRLVNLDTAAPRRRMSAAARRRISEGMKRRHAERRKAAATGAQPARSVRGTGITAAGRRKLSEIMKARWAARRKAAKKAA